LSRIARATAAVALLCSACQDSAGPDRVTLVEVTPGSAESWVGDTLDFRVVARRPDGSEISDPAVVWTSAPASVATVDETGRASAVGPGAAVISATVEGASGTATLVVHAEELLVEGDVGAGPELFRVPFDGGAPERILPPGTLALDPVASPDGSRIAFVVANYDDDDGDIWIVSRDGTDLRQLTTEPALDDAPAWSPDGTRIAFRSYRSGLLGEIWGVRDDGTGAVNLTPQTGPGLIDHHRPAWSPDGNRIAYASTAGGEWSIWTMRADGTDARQLTYAAEFETEPTWSPDGQWIAFRRNVAAGADIVIVPAAGGTETPIVMPGHQRHPEWSRDGRLLAFRGSSTLQDPPEVFTMQPDGDDVVPRTSASTWGAAQNPSWIRVAGR